LTVESLRTFVIRLLLVDDQPGARQGLKMWLELEPDVEVIGEAEDGQAALELADALHPDVVIMDIEMPGMDGISATRALSRRSQPVKVVMLSLYDDSATQARAREAGAVAFVAKHRMEEPLLAAIRAAAS
jgi:DNA-binding NarL/FixJ family response regulator